MSSRRYVIGLDLGDGESAIAWADVEDRRRVRLYTREGDETSVVTAIARDGDGRVIGERALRKADAREVLTNFKTMPSRTGVGLVEPLDSVEFAYWFVKDFAGKHPDIAAPDNCVLYIGHPAGWPADAVRIYGDQLEARLHPFEVRLVPESQSAFLHVHDESEVDPGVRPVLVVDIGSSTTDFTLVTDDGADNLPFGQAIGCRAIDEEVMAAVVAAVPDPDDLNRLSQDDEMALLRWLCRRHKEATFAGVEARAPRLEGRAAWVVETCWPLLAEVDVSALIDRPGGWRERLRLELAAVRDHLGESRPELVLTTGSGSRMPFVRDLCVAAFPDAEVASVDQPSLAVAKGLASYGRWRAKVDAFRAGVAALADSDAVDNVLADESRPLARRFYKVWINWSLDFTKREFREILAGYRAAKDSTDLATRRRLFVAWMATPDADPKRQQIFGSVETRLDRALTPIADALCRDCGLDATALDTKVELPPDVFVRLRVGRLRDLDAVFERTVGRMLDLFALSPFSRWAMRMMDGAVPSSIDHALTEAGNAMAAGLYRLSDDDIAELAEAIRLRVREQLLERAKAIETLLA